MSRDRQVELESILFQARALRDAMMFIYQSDTANVWRFSSYQTFIRNYHKVVIALAKHAPTVAELDFFDEEKIPGPYDTVAMTQKNYFDAVLANLSMLISITEHESGAKRTELDALLDFLQSRLRAAVLKLPEREKDIQDVVEQLMIGRGLSKGMDYDREVGRVKVSAKEVIPDFILPKLGLALEIKLLKHASERSPMIDAINADIQAYSRNYAYLAFLVCDLGIIRDEAEFKHGLANERNVFVLTVKH